jgi:hypothetical protein
MNTVFVAMITSTYEETLSRSREEWMMDMYKVPQPVTSYEWSSQPVASYGPCLSLHTLGGLTGSFALVRSQTRTWTRGMRCRCLSHQ